MSAMNVSGGGPQQAQVAKPKQPTVFESFEDLGKRFQEEANHLGSLASSLEGAIHLFVGNAEPPLAGAIPEDRPEPSSPAQRLSMALGDIREKRERLYRAMLELR